jgi:uncharacterized protein YoaH (UPF0181 family)
VTAEPRPRWVHLTDEQRDIAADLYERAQVLMAGGRMSIGEALDTAAIQAGHIPHLFDAPPDQDPEHGAWSRE